MTEKWMSSHKKHLVPVSDNPELWQEYYGLATSEGTKIKFKKGNTEVTIINWLDQGLGFRIITSKGKTSFFPFNIHDAGIKATLRGISEFENSFEALMSFELPHNVHLVSFAPDHIANSSSSQLGTQIHIAFTGWAYSLSHQMDPPTITQGGKKIITRGSSIFYHPLDKKNILDDYLYQFYVEEVDSWIWNDFLIVYKITTTLFRLPEIKIPMVLYATERTLQNNYIPEVGDDIMGLLWFSSHILSKI